jgi:hypothetical protein
MKRLLGITGAIALCFIFATGLWLFIRLTQFRAGIEQVKANGHPISIADLQKPNSEEAEAALNSFNQLIPKIEAFETAMWEDEEALSRPVDEAMLARFDELVATYPELFPALEELSQRTEIGFDVQGDSQEFLDALMDRVHKPRSIARIVAWKARILTAQDKPNEAVETSLQTLRLARLFGNEPMLVSQLVTIACRGIAIDSIDEILASEQLSTETATRLNDELELHDSFAGYKTCLLGERAYGIESTSELGILVQAYGGKGYLDVLSNAIEDADKEAFEQNDASRTEYSTWKDGQLGEMLIPALDQIQAAISRTRSQIRALRIINALQSRAEADSASEIIAQDEISQDELVTLGVPMKMTVDTMNGKPMIVKRDGDRWLVYSVGLNLIDDGGNLESAPDQNDFGLGGE